MLKTIKARCVNGALAPPEPVELREGDEYEINLGIHPSRPGADVQRRLLPAGAWQDEDEYWEEAQRMLYEARRLGSRVVPEP